MSAEKIKVFAYSGYREEETPRAFIKEGAWVDVLKVLDRWVEESAATGERRRCFRVKGSDWRSHMLCYRERNGEWTVD